MIVLRSQSVNREESGSETGLLGANTRPPDLYTLLPNCMLSHFSHVQLFATPWTVARQVPLSLGFSRQEHWSGLPCPPPGGLPNPWVEHTSLTSPALAGSLFTTNATWEAQAPEKSDHDRRKDSERGKQVSGEKSHSSGELGPSAASSVCSFIKDGSMVGDSVSCPSRDISGDACELQSWGSSLQSH